MWVRRNKADGPSTLRYCQTAFELPLLELYESKVFTVAIAQTCRPLDFPKTKEADKYALGVLHLERGLWFDGAVDPVLPCKITFTDHLLSDEEGTIGRADLDYWTSEPPLYRLEIYIEDPQGELFDMLETGLAHAAISKRQFLHATFVKPKPAEKPAGTWEERAARLKALAQRVHAGEENLTSVPVASVWLQDRTTTGAPLWAHAWEEADTLEGSAFHDRMAAKARAKRSWPRPRKKSE